MTMEEAIDPMLYADSNASSHVINSSSMIYNAKPYKGMKKLFVGKGDTLTMTYIGNEIIQFSNSSLKLKKMFLLFIK